MNSAWDIFGQSEKPSLVLCNPNKEMLYSLGNASDVSLKWKFNALSEMTFKFPQSIGDGGLLEAYSYVQSKRVVYLENFGYFLITNVEEDLTGKVNIKYVTANSLEAELIFKKVTAFIGTFQFYNPISPANTLLGLMVSLLPNWSVAYVDGALLPLYRTFNVPDKTIYDFLMNDVSTAFQCVFAFDSANRTISAYSIPNATVDTDIFLSFDNLLKSGKLKELTDELVTALHVYGSGSLDIHYVNPLGMSTIYNFDYYKNTDWMSQGLIDAITAWEALIAIKQPIFATHLTELSEAYLALLVLQGQLDDLTGQKQALIAVRKVRIQDGLGYADITTQIKALKVLITSKTNEIATKNATITNIQNNLASITQSLSFANSFTSDQLLELNPFIIENTYQNNNFLITDSMNAADIQAESQRLYDQALQVLAKVSQPRYEVSFDTANFLFLHSFKPFVDQVQLGAVVTVDAGSNGDGGTPFKLVLLEIDINLDDPTNFQLTLSNRVRLDKEGFVYSDLFNQAINAGTSVNFNASGWSNWGEHKDDVTGFIESALNAANNNIISSDNQEIVIDENGLVGKEYDPATHDYKGDQVWLMNNMLGFTSDAWDSAKLALGKITVNGLTTFGLVADVLVGRILAGNQLTIANQNNTFTLDGTGATLVNATLSIIGNGGNSKIFLDPVTGFKIQTLVNNAFVDKFFVDGAGNVTLAGKLVGATGDFSGAINALSGTIGALSVGPIPIAGGTGLYVTAEPGNYYIKSNGEMKWGALTMAGGVLSFNGTIDATKLSDGTLAGSKLINNTITSSKIQSITADKIAVGTLTGMTIIGSTIQWGDTTNYAKMFSNTYGRLMVQYTNSLAIGKAKTGGFIDQPSITFDAVGQNVDIAAPNVYVGSYTGTVTLRGAVNVIAGQAEFQNNIYSNISGLGGFGKNLTAWIYSKATEFGTAAFRRFTWDNGILVWADI